MKERIKFDFHGVEVTGVAIKHFIDEDGDWFLVRVDPICVEENDIHYIYCRIEDATPITLRLYPQTAKDMGLDL